jgi:hypothetical protein
MVGSDTWHLLQCTVIQYYFVVCTPPDSGVGISEPDPVLKPLDVSQHSTSLAQGTVMVLPLRSFVGLCYSTVID